MNGAAVVGHRVVARQASWRLQVHALEFEKEKDRRFDELVEACGARLSKKDRNQANGGKCPACGSGLSIRKYGDRRRDWMPVHCHADGNRIDPGCEPREMLEALDFDEDHLRVVVSEKKTALRRPINEVLGGDFIHVYSQLLISEMGLNARDAIVFSQFLYLRNVFKEHKQKPREWDFWRKTNELVSETGLSKKRVLRATEKLREEKLIETSDVVTNKVEHRTYYRIPSEADDLIEAVREKLRERRKKELLKRLPWKFDDEIDEELDKEWEAWVGVTPTLVKEYGPIQALVIGALVYKSEYCVESNGIFAVPGEDLQKRTGRSCRELIDDRRALERYGVIETYFDEWANITWYWVDILRLKKLPSPPMATRK
jgi:hypothetical protein